MVRKRKEESKVKELLFSITKKDFEVTYFSGSGPGGQHRNKHKNCVRIKHIATGIITTGQDHRSQDQNQKDAFIRMTNHPKFKMYIAQRIQEAVNSGPSVDDKIDEEMDPKNLKVETIRDGMWYTDQK